MVISGNSAYALLVCFLPAADMNPTRGGVGYLRNEGFTGHLRPSEGVKDKSVLDHN
jgi:hypothetical protein